MRAIFLVRSGVLALVTTGILVVDVRGELDELRFLLASISGAAVVYNLLLSAVASRFPRVPLAVFIIDILATAAVIPTAEPLESAALLVMLSSLAAASISHPLRRVVPVMAMAIVAVATTSTIALDADQAIVTVMAFTCTSALTVFPTAISRAHETRVAAGHADLLSSIEALVWSLREDAAEYDMIAGAGGRTLGHPDQALIQVAEYLDLVHADDRDEVIRIRAAVLRGGGRGEVDYRLRTATGQWRWLRETIAADPFEPHGRRGLRGVATDITGRREAEEQRSLYEHVVENIETAIIVARLDSEKDALVLEAANPAAARIFASSPNALKGQSLADLLGDDDESIAERSRAVATMGQGFEIERHQGLGLERQKTFSISAFALPGQVVGLAIADVTGAVMVAAALRRQALHDGLTGLPNRTLLRDRLRFALADAKRRSERVALIMLDLNHFKEVNDALGHQYGDRLLIAFAKRLTDLLRECDTIARLGGDEFALLLTHATNEGAARVVKKVTEAMHEPFELDGVIVQTTASLGVAIFPDHAENADLLTQRADVAMYTAKRGGGGWSMYSPSQDESSIERLQLLSELHAELDNGRPTTLTVAYQPLYDLEADRISGAEALLRWPHPSMGNLNPEMVVELAELSGLIGNLAQFVAFEATREARRWLTDGHDLTIAINLSARNLYDRNLTTWLTDILAETGLPPDRLKCELTESELMDDPVLAMNVITAIGELGIKTAIDDFGTGYSSLSYLRQLRVDEIKIDKSFVMSMMEDRNDLTIVRAVIDLAHNLGMSVLAEGVEDQATMDQLRAFGCNRIQGYHIARPLPAAEFSRLIASQASPGLAIPGSGTRIPGQLSPVPEVRPTTKSGQLSR